MLINVSKSILYMYHDQQLLFPEKYMQKNYKDTMNCSVIQNYEKHFLNFVYHEVFVSIYDFQSEKHYI